jgi:hypothetical protein
VVDEGKKRLKPDNWAQMNRSQKKHWRDRNSDTGGKVAASCPL